MHRVVSIGALVDSDSAKSTGLSLDALITGVVNLCAFLLDKTNSDELLQTTLSMYQGCARSEVKSCFPQRGSELSALSARLRVRGDAARRAAPAQACTPLYCGCVFARGSTGRGAD